MADILIIDDNSELRTEIRLFLEARGHAVACASDGAEGYDEMTRIAYDVILMDVRMPGLSGTEVLKRAHERLPCHPPVIMVTGHADKSTAITALHFGAFDFIEKPFKPELLEAAVARALADRRQDAASFRAFLETSRAGELTPRERQVAFLAAEGLSNEAIAGRLSLSGETVKSHLKRIFRKLGVASRAALGGRLRG